MTQPPCVPNLRAAAQGGRAALGLLTILPVGSAPVGPAALRAAPAWFPLVGGLVGALAAGIWALVEPALGSAYATGSRSRSRPLPRAACTTTASPTRLTASARAAMPRGGSRRCATRGSALSARSH